MSNEMVFMASSSITVATASAYRDGAGSSDQLIDITFTNIAAFTYLAGNIYYFVTLTDSTTPTAKTQDVIVTVPQSAGGTFTAAHSEVITIENTQALVPDGSGNLTASNGRIVYKAS